MSRFIAGRTALITTVILGCVSSAASSEAGSSDAGDPRLHRNFALFDRVGIGAPRSAPRVFSPGRPFGGAVSSIVPDGTGGWFIGGKFKRVGTTSCQHFARIRSTGELDKRFCARPDGPVYQIAQRRTQLLFVGAFTHIGGRSRRYAAALDTRTGRLLSWDALITGRPEPSNFGGLVERNVAAIAVSGNWLYLLGRFDHVRGIPRNGLARVAADTGDVSPWNPGVEAYSNRDYGAPLAVGAGRVFVVTETGLASIDTRSGRSVIWPVAGLIKVLLVSGKHLYVGGDSAGGPGVLVNGRKQGVVAVLNAGSGRSSGRFSAIGPDGAAEVHALMLSSSTLFVGGAFAKAAGTHRIGLAAFSVRTGKLLPWRPLGARGAQGFIGAIAVSPGVVAVGCSFCE
jgi:hypothetical protein